MPRNRIEQLPDMYDKVADALAADILMRADSAAVAYAPVVYQPETRYAPRAPKNTPSPISTQEKTRNRLPYVVAGVGAVVGGVIMNAFMDQEEAGTDNCTSASSRQIVVERGFNASVRSLFERGGVSGEQTVKGVRSLLQKERGYSFSTESFLAANKETGIISRDDEGKLQQDIEAGVYCVNVPAPAFYGFQWSGNETTLKELASANLTTPENIQKLNPGLGKYDKEDVLPAGMLVQVDPQPNNNFVYREMKDTENDINTLSDGDEAARNQLLRLNAAILGTGGSVAAGEKAWLPHQPTEWMESNEISTEDVQAAFPVTALSVRFEAAQIAENKNTTHAMPQGFTRDLVKAARKEAALWPKGQTDKWDGVENSNPYIAKYTEGELGPEQSWCAFFVRYVMNRAGASISLTEKLNGQSYYMPRVRDMYNWMVNGNNKSFYVYSRDAIIEDKKTEYMPGDVIFFNYEGSEQKFKASKGNHVGIITAVGQRLTILDGNYHETDTVTERKIAPNDVQIMAVARAIEERASVSGIEIPPQRTVTPAESRQATDSLIERGNDWANRARAMRFFMDNGLEDFQAAGLVGNFVIESGSVRMPADIKQYGGGPGRGFVQWEVGGRFDAERENLVDFAKAQGTSWEDFDTQLQFVMHELKTTEQKAYGLLKKTSNVQEAADAVLNGYERPAVRNVEPRAIEAEKILAAYRQALPNA